MSEHLAIEEQARRIMTECSRVGFLAFMQGLSDSDRLELANALFGSGLVISDEWQAISRDSELLALRRTIGDAQWLDNLDDEQWRVLVHEIMPPFYQEEWRRGETSTRLDKKLKFLGALNNALEVTRNPDVTPADIEQALNSVLEHYKDDEALNILFSGETSED